MPRSLSDDATYELALHNYWVFNNNYRGKPYSKPEKRAAFSIMSTYLYQQSASSEMLAQYFLKCGKCCLEVREDGLGDIGSGYLNIFGENPTVVPADLTTPFSSNISVAPRRRVYGGIINIHHDLSAIRDGLWYKVYMPLVRVEDDMRLCESNIVNPGVFPDSAGDVITNATQAFEQRDWRYGKIACGKVAVSAIDDIDFKLGWTFLDRKNYNLGIYFDALIPMGNRPNGEFMFEPVVGNGGHGGVGFGTNFNWNFWHKKKHQLTFSLDFRYRYLFSAHERRSFDVTCNGDWSRYLVVADASNPCIGCPGINFFTQDLKVTPRSTINLWSALHYQYSSFGFEFGYNLWYRQSEKVCLDDCCWDDEAIGFLDAQRAFAVTNCASFTSSSKAQLCNGLGPVALAAGTAAAADEVFTPITRADLNLTPAAHPSALSNKIYAAVSVDSKFFDTKASIGFGGAYEFGECGRSLNNWSVWLKTALSF